VEERGKAVLLVSPVNLIEKGEEERLGGRVRWVLLIDMLTAMVVQTDLRP